MTTFPLLSSTNLPELDVQTKAFLEKYGSTPFLDINAPIATIRRNFDAFYEEIGAPLVEVGEIQNRTIPAANGGVPIRIYYPRGVPTGALPLVLFYHGGGASWGSLDSAYDRMARHISNESGAILISVDYRLSPEHKFPAGIEDAYAAVVWASENGKSIGGDPSKIGLCGESGGGNFAAVVSQLTKQRNGPKIKYQVLIYPAIGTRGNSKSIELFSQGYFVEIASLNWIYEQYLPDMSLGSDPRVSPILAEDFSGLPSTFVITAGFDMLRDDGEEYVSLLRQASVPAEFHRYETTIHGFLCMAGVIDVGLDAIRECGAKLRAGLS